MLKMRKMTMNVIHIPIRFLMRQKIIKSIRNSIGEKVSERIDKQVERMRDSIKTKELTYHDAIHKELRRVRGRTE